MKEDSFKADLFLITISCSVILWAVFYKVPV
jgi:hypothetical protein